MAERMAVDKGRQYIKLMQLDRLPVEIRFKSDSNRLLIDICDLKLLLKCIEIVATIRIRIQISN